MIHLSALSLFAERGMSYGSSMSEEKLSKQDEEIEAQETEAESEKEDDGKRITFELELDAYYTCADMYINLTNKPVPYVEDLGEVEIYKELFTSSLYPRVVVFEASVYPLPNLGVFIKRNYEGFYDDHDIGDDFNLLESITAGFEEPFAFSLFLGNVISFSKPGEKRKANNNGYMGYLYSMGSYHIKDNVLINDNWFELEWKIKGDKKTEKQKLNWSLRIGTKVHQNPEIADTIHFSIRRSRVDFDASVMSLLQNSGFEYTFTIDRNSLDVVSHFLSVEKNWPMKNKKYAFNLTIGCIYEANRKYNGSLFDEGVDNFKAFIWPNIKF